MAYKYTYDEWQELKTERERERQAEARAYLEDMDAWGALREEQCRTKSSDLASLVAAKGLE